MSRRQERISVILDSPVASRRGDRNKRRQIFILQTEAVAHPSTNTRPDQVGLTGMQSQQGFAMGAAFGMHRFYNAHLVGLPRKLGKQFAEPDSALAVLREFERS